MKTDRDAFEKRFLSTHAMEEYGDAEYAYKMWQSGVDYERKRNRELLVMGWCALGLLMPRTERGHPSHTELVAAITVRNALNEAIGGE